jgi:arylsulfatase A
MCQMGPVVRFIIPFALALLPLSLAPAAHKPNIVFIFCDDLGYSDIGCNGAEKKKTPNIDRMAEQGVNFTDFHVTAPVCSPSRASLMTGCYPLRVDLARSWAGPYVLLPADKKGLNPEETTLAEMLKAAGYATGMFGKWHLGDQPEFMPTNQGFDEYYGIPFSNDMKRKAGRKGAANHGHYLPMFRNKEVVELSPDQRYLTRNLTREAIRFIREHKDGPFFVYLPHPMPHVPVYASPEFEGKSGHGIYGDAVQELDGSVGEILDALKQLGIDRNTLVVFSSDNGAINHGENHPLAGGKGTILEGGMRVPCVMRWPAGMPAGRTCGELITVMDFLPTFARLAGGKLPEKKIDGHDILPLMAGEEEARSPYEVFYHYRIDQLRAIRSGKWKLHLALDPTLEGWDGKRSGTAELALYDLDADIGESKNVAAEHPEVVARLTAYVEKARNDLGDWNIEGGGRRKAGWVDAPVHPAEGVDLKPTDWIGNPDSPAAAAAQKQQAE